MSDWQDISTAPKDGTDILVSNNEKDVRLSYFCEGDWFVPHHSSPTGTLLEDVMKGKPTHWIPIPIPPIEPLAARAKRLGMQMIG